MRKVFGKMDDSETFAQEAELFKGALSERDMDVVVDVVRQSGTDPRDHADFCQPTDVRA